MTALPKQSSGKFFHGTAAFAMKSAEKASPEHIKTSFRRLEAGVAREKT
ncbi:MAG: hypothetical protein ABF617_07810 [Gluconobacter japonicus]